MKKIQHTQNLSIHCSFAMIGLMWLLFLPSFSLTGQVEQVENNAQVLHIHDRTDCSCKLVGSGVVENTRLLAPRSIRLGSGDLQVHSMNPEAPVSPIHNTESKLEFFKLQFDGEIPNTVTEAILYAIRIWDYYLESDVPVTIRFSWEHLEGDQILAQAGPSDFAVGEPINEELVLFEPVSIYRRKHQIEEMQGADIHISLNASESDQFYYGVDGNCPSNRYDLVSIVLHEIGHGLGLVDSVRIESRNSKDPLPPLPFASIGYNFVESRIILNYDEYLYTNDGRQLSDANAFEYPSTELFDAATSNSVSFYGPLAMKSNLGQPVSIYAPETWEPGSSVSHLDENTYRAGSAHSLMTPYIGLGEVIHNPGSLTIAILGDLGWNHVWIHHTEHKDIETANEEIEIETSIQSDSQIIEKPILYYRNEKDQAYASVEMTFTPQSGNYKAQIAADPNLKEQVIEYYIEVKGSADRVFTLPNLVNTHPFDIKISEDFTPPSISHTANKFVLGTDADLQIPFQEEDNLGLESVSVLVWIDGLPTSPEVTSLDNDGHFLATVAKENLKGRSHVAYQITATDASQRKHKTTKPTHGNYEITIETKGSTVPEFVDNFDSGSFAFVLDGLSVQHTAGFSPYLGSQHPYSNHNTLTQLNDLSAYLRHPITVFEDTILKFEEIVLVEPGMVDTNYGDHAFNDYVVVEFSTDSGLTWKPLLSGWDSSDDPEWKHQFESHLDVSLNSLSPADPSLYRTREIQMTSNPEIEEGDTIMIRFVLHADSSINGWGWAIDNLSITRGF